MKRLCADQGGAAAVEFALVVPIFLMFLFLLLDGGRFFFTKQALTELATATARCAAVKPTGCTTVADVQTWAVNRGSTLSGLTLTTSMIAVVQSTTCNGQSAMAQATITMPLVKGSTMLLPQSVLPTNLVVQSCFPVLS